MKRILLLTLFIALSFTASYSQSGAENTVPMALTSDVNVIEADKSALDAERGVVFFSEDFLYGFDGNNSFGSWTISDNGIEDIWRIGDSSENPLSEGQFSQNAGTFASESADNGYALFDMDGYNTDFDLYAGTPPSITGYLNFPELDMSGLETVIVEYQTYFRYCCFPFSPLTLQVSVDGGDNWTLFEAKGASAAAANAASINGDVVKMDISCAASGQESVMLRFSFNSELADIFATYGGSYFTYHWAIDDVLIYTNEQVNDLEIEYVTNGDVFNVWEYRNTPLEQAITDENGGLLAGTVFRNNGSSDATNVTVTVEILDETETTVLHTITSDPFDVSSNLNSPICPQQDQDTLYMETGWVPTDIGNYYLRSTISVDGVMDETPEDNVFGKIIEYTLDEMGHDNEDNLTGQTNLIETSTGSGEFNPTGAGNFYHMENDNTTAYGVLIAVGPDSDPGPEFDIRLFYYDNTQGLDGSFFDQTFYGLDEAWISGANDVNWVYFPYEDEIELEAGEAYFAAAVHDFTDTQQFRLLTEPNSDADNSTGSYTLGGDGNMHWFTSQTFSPAVRLITSERVGVNDVAIQEGVLLEQNVPNPAIDQTMISYNLTWSRDVKFEIHDLSGRIIESIDMGTQVPGAHQFNLDVTDYPSGLYYYTMTADQYQTTRKLVVAGK